jgi:Polyketide cyclase / dehydrase and lipid transport
MAGLPVNPPEWIDAAPICVERSIDIAAAPHVVWGRIADHLTWPEWFTALDSVRITGASSGVGGGRRVTANRVSMDEEFTVWDEDAHFAFAVTGTKLPILAAMAESVRLEPIGEGCRVTYRQGLQGRRGFGRVLDAIWKRQGAPALDDALANLKRLCE